MLIYYSTLVFHFYKENHLNHSEVVLEGPVCRCDCGCGCDCGVVGVGVVAEIHRQHQHQHSLGQMSCSSCSIKCEPFVVGTSMNSNLYTNEKKHYTAIQKQNEIVVPWKFLLIELLLHEKLLR